MAPVAHYTRRARAAQARIQQRLAAERTRQGLSYQRLSALSGYPIATVHELLVGVRSSRRRARVAYSPSFAVLDAVAQALGFHLQLVDTRTPSRNRP